MDDGKYQSYFKHIKCFFMPNENVDFKRSQACNANSEMTINKFKKQCTLNARRHFNSIRIIIACHK